MLPHGAAITTAAVPAVGGFSLGVGLFFNVCLFNEYFANQTTFLQASQRHAEQTQGLVRTL